MLFCLQCDIALSLTLAAPILECFRRPWRCSYRLPLSSHGKSIHLNYFDTPVSLPHSTRVYWFKFSTRKFVVSWFVPCRLFSWRLSLSSVFCHTLYISFWVNNRWSFYCYVLVQLIAYLHCTLQYILFILSNAYLI